MSAAAVLALLGRSAAATLGRVGVAGGVAALELVGEQLAVGGGSVAVSGPLMACCHHALSAHGSSRRKLIRP